MEILGGFSQVREHFSVVQEHSSQVEELPWEKRTAHLQEISKQHGRYGDGGDSDGGDDGGDDNEEEEQE